MAAKRYKKRKLHLPLVPHIQMDQASLWSQLFPETIGQITRKMKQWRGEDKTRRIGSTSLSRDNEDDTEKVSCKCKFAFRQTFLEYFKSFKKCFSNYSRIKLAIRRVQAKNRKFVAKSARRPRNCKTCQFTKLIGREQLRNVPKNKEHSHVQSVQNYCFSL